MMRLSQTVAAAVLLIGVVGCQPNAAPTQPAAPTLEVLPTTAAEEGIWLEQPFGGGTLAVYFYTAADGANCVRFLADLPNGQPFSACAAPNVLAAIAQGVIRTAEGQDYTIIAARTLHTDITTLVVELRGGESYPLAVDDGGALLILPSVQQVWQAVPIDAFGNTVGSLIRLGTP